ncbi:hypothetical protein B2G74_33170 [Burkholderia sp. A27]|nr:hypothetical protein B2G74_33170 [Burkholderia sp. A27]
MRISLIDNGLDSLRKAYSFLKEYEDLREAGAEEIPRFFKLKDAILSMQHGIEILLKYLLSSQNEILLFSEINQKLRAAYARRRAGDIEHLYENDDVHTVTFKESIDRVNDICGLHVPEKLRKDLLKVEKWRNSITHAAILQNEQEVSGVLSRLMPQLDEFFSPTIGDTYVQGQGRSELDRAFRLFKTVHGEHPNTAKSAVIERLIRSLQENNIKSVTAPGVFSTDDVSKAYSILCNMQGGGITYGADMINLHCSGEMQISNLDPDGVMELYAVDIEVRYTFQFDRLVVYVPQVEGSTSPLIFVYAKKSPVLGNDPDLSEKFGYQTQAGIEFVDDGSAEWGKEAIYRMLDAENEQGESSDGGDDDFPTSRTLNRHFIRKYRFLSHCCVCFMNIQTLSHGAAKQILYSEGQMGGPDALTRSLRATLDAKTR